MRLKRETLALGVLFLSLVMARHGWAATTYSSTDVPKTIAPSGTITSTLEVAEGGSIDDLDVELTIGFPWDEDLDVYLVGPDGTRVELFTDVGGMGEDFIHTVLDDDAATSIQDGQAPFTGRYQPEGSLSDLTGAERQGTWELEVTNDGGWFMGTLDSWSLVFDTGDGGDDCPALAEPVTPTPLDGATDVPVDVVLSWKLGTGGVPAFRLLATTGEDGPDPLSLFELQTDPAAAVRIDDSCGLYALDFSADGQLYGSDDYTLWTMALDGPAVVCTEIGDFHSATDPSILITGLAFHPDGTLYASTFDFVNFTSVIYTVDETTAYLTEVCRIPILDGIAWAIDFSPEGELFAAFEFLMIIDLDTCEVLYGDNVVATDIDFAPDGFLYAIDNESRILTQMDPAIGIVVAEYGPYEIAPWGLASEILGTPAQAMQFAAGLSAGERDSGPSAAMLTRRTLRAELRRLLDGGLGAEDDGAAAGLAPALIAEQGADPTSAAEEDPNRLTFDVFLDAATTPKRLLCGDTELQQCDPGGLDACTTYYWQVLVKNNCGQTLAGPVWSFTTESVPADFDDDCDVDFDDLAVFARYWLFSPQ